MQASASELKDLCKPSIFALVNRNDKRIYLAQSCNALLAISHLCDKLNKGTYRYKELIEDYRNNKIELILISSSLDEVSRKIQLRELQDRYRNQGYFLYNRFKSSRYRVGYTYNKKRRTIEINLVSNDNSKILVGVFNNMKEADDFVALYYSSEYPLVVYANNQDTRECYNNIHRYNNKN